MLFELLALIFASTVVYHSYDTMTKSDSPRQPAIVDRFYNLSREELRSIIIQNLRIQTENFAPTIEINQNIDLLLVNLSIINIQLKNFTFDDEDIDLLFDPLYHSIRIKGFLKQVSVDINVKMTDFFEETTYFNFSLDIVGVDVEARFLLNINILKLCEDRFNYLKFEKFRFPITNQNRILEEYLQRWSDYTMDAFKEIIEKKIVDYYSDFIDLSRISFQIFNTNDCVQSIQITDEDTFTVHVKIREDQNFVLK